MIAIEPRIVDVGARLIADISHDQKDKDSQVKEESGHGGDTDDAAGQDMHHQPREQSRMKMMPTAELMAEHDARQRSGSLFLMFMIILEASGHSSHATLSAGRSI